MPQKPEAATQPPSGEVAGNSEPELAPSVVQALTDDLAQAHELALNQQEALQAQQDEIAEMKTTMAALMAKVAPKAKEKKAVKPPPDGSKRYYSKGAEPLYVKEGAHRIIMDGHVVSYPQTGADFTGHVYETNDPQIIEWLDTHPENGKSFWEDPAAVRSNTDVHLIEGVRGAEQAPTAARNPLAAPMQ